jgi:hypothetical protein
MNVTRASWMTGFVVILLAAALAGCGGSSNDSASSGDTTTSQGGASQNGTTLDNWAAGLCQGVASWKQTIKTTAAQLNSSQTDFASASQAVSSTNQALLSSLDGLGTPPAPASADAKQVIDELSASLQADGADIQQALNGNFSSQSEIAQATAKARASIVKMNADIAKAVKKLRALPDEEGWKKAFRANPACQLAAKPLKPT